MPEVRRGAARNRGMTVPGIFAALLDKEALHLERTPLDPRCGHLHDHGPAGPSPQCHASRRRLESLEAGELQLMQGRQLKMLLPQARRRREDALEWFEVRSDDTIRRCQPPDD